MLSHAATAIAELLRDELGIRKAAEHLHLDAKAISTEEPSVAVDRSFGDVGFTRGPRLHLSRDRVGDPQLVSALQVCHVHLLEWGDGDVGVVEDLRPVKENASGAVESQKLFVLLHDERSAHAAVPPDAVATHDIAVENRDLISFTHYPLLPPRMNVLFYIKTS